ncbi:laccase-2-like [Anoplophora glabripennis]|uniref:laccase-2-like n=1 Tax=Anoplophora glabripennis TaxID=217634 RepID=UPI0008758094|nr:laccase-2-like [Anoplophora glabripennis]
MVENRCSNNRGSKMSGASSLVLRASIVLGMVAAVVTVLYFTPIPDPNFKSCDRPCHDLDWPMICRVKLTIEMYQTVNQDCQDCPENSTDCSSSYCTSAEGSLRGIIIANRQLPGPAIQVCQNDILVVDVTNKIPGHSLTMHWRGQPNHEAPFMDGVPMVTQCPILSYTTFQYKFRASSPGTHFYHAYSDSDRTDGLFGALIVRQADKLEPHRKLYDVDSKDHIILLSEWSGDRSSLFEDEDELPKAILVNGKAPSVSGPTPTLFNVEKERRYRFRVAYTGGSVGCPITVSIDKHLLKIIAVDGTPINPYEVSSAELSKGERFDFVLKTTREDGAYFLRASSSCNSREIHGLAVISYGGSGVEATERKKDEKLRHFETSLCKSEIGKVCLGDVRPLNKILPELRDPQVDRQIYLGFDSALGTMDIDTGFKETPSKIYRINNFTFTYPPSPILTQPDDVASNLMCNELNVPQKCAGQAVCECVHMEHIALGSTTEIILIDQGGDQDEHIFHLHGYHFYIVGSNTFDKALTRHEAEKLDADNRLMKRNLVNPLLKDTIRVPKFGVVALRFFAKNPGFWMLRDEQSRGWTRGMDVIFQVGDLGDVVTIPTNFPTCGSFIGPDFFLL